MNKFENFFKEIDPNFHGFEQLSLEEEELVNISLFDNLFIEPTGERLFDE
jgi:hypothetical protein